MGIIPSRFTVPQESLRQGANPSSRPLSYAAGQLGYAQLAAQQTGIGTGLTDITGLSVLFNVGASRRVKVTGNVIIISNSGAINKAALYVIEGVTRIGFGEEIMSSSPNSSSNVIAQRILTPSAGSHTYKLAIQFNAGAGNIVYTDPSNGQFSYILVEDIGAA